MPIAAFVPRTNWRPYGKDWLVQARIQHTISPASTSQTKNQHERLVQAKNLLSGSMLVVLVDHSQLAVQTPLRTGQSSPIQATSSRPSIWSPQGCSRFSID